jgi:hypothetical protein
LMIDVIDVIDVVDVVDVIYYCMCVCVRVCART